MPAPRATEATIRRALSVWTAQGLPVGKLEVLPDGTVAITAPQEKMKAEAVAAGGPKQWRKD